MSSYGLGTPLASPICWPTTASFIRRWFTPHKSARRSRSCGASCDLVVECWSGHKLGDEARADLHSDPATPMRNQESVMRQTILPRALSVGLLFVGACI